MTESDYGRSEILDEHDGGIADAESHEDTSHSSSQERMLHGLIAKMDLLASVGDLFARYLLDEYLHWESNARGFLAEHGFVSRNGDTADMLMNNLGSFLGKESNDEALKIMHEFQGLKDWLRRHAREDGTNPIDIEIQRNTIFVKTGVYHALDEFPQVA